MGFKIDTYVFGCGGRSQEAKRGQPASHADACAGWKTAAQLLATLDLRVHERKGELMARRRCRSSVT